MTQFKKEHIPHNKGKKREEYMSEEAIKKVQATQFTNEVVGDKHKSWKGGITNNTKDAILVWTGPNTRARRPVLTYENMYKKPPQYIIYHLDGDKNNDIIENLIAIPRALLITLNAGRLNNTRESIERAIKEYELEQNKKLNL